MPSQLWPLIIHKDNIGSTKVFFQEQYCKVCHDGKHCLDNQTGFDKNQKFSQTIQRVLHYYRVTPRIIPPYTYSVPTGHLQVKVQQIFCLELEAWAVILLLTFFLPFVFKVNMVGCAVYNMKKKNPHTAVAGGVKKQRRRTKSSQTWH